MSIHSDHLLWLDLETTGSDHARDEIIEIGCVLTDTDLNELGAYRRVVVPGDEALGRMMRNKVVRQMHEANGLLDEVLDGVGARPDVVCGELLTWLTEKGTVQRRVVLAGSGVGHFDRRFIDRYMPPLARHLRHWVIDVGVIRRAHEMWVGDGPTAVNETKTHRAIDDAYLHLTEARAYRELWTR